MLASDDPNQQRKPAAPTRKLTDAEQREQDIKQHEEDIFYSARYADDNHEYRHVVLPREIARWVPPGRLMTEIEWRSLGVKQSQGWSHYLIHGPEPHILLFKRDKEPDPAQQKK
ncbi:regulatory subunit of cyclin-dependent kinase [Zopfochytrium polystomum]|nr:regulatory subunit of cyclin-dependent kinase [Zopfochytrium polystomum]